MRSLIRPALLSCAILMMAEAGEVKASDNCGPFRLFHRFLDWCHVCRTSSCKPVVVSRQSGAAAVERSQLPAQGPEKIVPPKPADTTAPKADTAPSPSAIDIENRLKAWQAANPSGVTGQVQRVTIQVDGKPVLLEIRVVGSSTGPISPSVPDNELAQSLKEALTKDVVPDAVKASGRTQLARIYDGLARLLSAGGVDTLEATYDLRDKLPDSQKEAKQLKETMKAIQAFLDKQFTDINPKASLSKESTAKVLATFRLVADTLRGLP